LLPGSKLLLPGREILFPWSNMLLPASKILLPGGKILLPGMGAGNIYTMPGPAGVRPGPGRGPGVDFYLVFIR